MRLNPPQLLLVSFLGCIFAGTFLLLLPGAVHGPGQLGFVDALFTSTSAICVTGLSVVDTGTFFTPFGQAIILFLIQVGGLGIMTFSMFFAVLMGRRLTIREHNVFMLSLGENRVEGILHLLKYIVYITLIAEALGFLSFFGQFYWRYGFGLGESAWLALFHAISGFCNAGFSVFSDSFSGFRSDPWVNATIIGLAVAGGIGFVVILDFVGFFGSRYRKRPVPFRFSLQSKMVLPIMAGLTVVGSAFFFWILGGQGWTFSERSTTSFFLTLCVPTAGFGIMNLSELPIPGTFFLMLLIYIGGSPGSTAGGIKTTSFVIIAMVAYSMLVHRNRIFLLERAIPQHIVRKVLILFIVSLGIGFLFAWALLFSEHAVSGRHPNFFLTHIFEIVSALGTSGASLGITASLSSAGKCIVLAAMFVGRVGLLTLALAAATKEQKITIQYPEENVMVW